jgi:mono/diheme cytochrome c family protein
MHRLLVTSTIFGLITISGLAFTLIAIVISRSPYTHGNLSPQGYHRTEIALVGEEQPFEGIGLADPQLARTGDPVQDGRALFFQYGCTSCHGLKGEGEAVGKAISGDSALKITSKVREGPKNMPAFHTSVLSDSDLQKIIAFLQSIKH